MTVQNLVEISEIKNIEAGIDLQLISDTFYLISNGKFLVQYDVYSVELGKGDVLSSYLILLKIFNYHKGSKPQMVFRIIT